MNRIIGRIRYIAVAIGFLFVFFMDGCSYTTLVSGSSSEEISSVSASKIESEIDLSECEGLIRDINVIEETLKNSICSNSYDENSFDKLIEDVIEKKLDRVECYYRLTAILSDYNCAHLYLQPQASLDESLVSECFPLFIKEFEGDYYIVLTLNQYQEHLGKKIVSMGNCPISMVVDRLSEVCSIETESAKRRVLESDSRGLFSVAKPTLRYCGLLDANDNLVVEVEGGENTIDSFTISAIKTNGKYDWCHLVTDRIEYEKNYESGNNYCFYGDKENGIMYFEYFLCKDQEVTFENCFSDMMKELGGCDKYHSIIFNVKDNVGGNRFLARDMLIKYQDELSPLQKYVVIGSGTASAGQQFVEDCLELFPDIKIYGDETAQAVDNFTEINQIELDSLGVWLCFPTLDDYVPLLASRAADKKKGVIPDVFVVQTFEDYTDGIDSIYSRILSDINMETH